MDEDRPEAPAAPEPPDTKARRAPWWLVAVLLVLAVGVGVGAGAWVWAGRVTYPPGYPMLTAEQYDECLRQATIYFDGDDPDPAMRAAVAQLRADDRFESVRGETRQESYEKFKETFAEQPELVKLARPEGLPATVYLMVREGSTAKQLESALRAEFPDAQLMIREWCPEPPD
jgi:hypothetical protein